MNKYALIGVCLLAWFGASAVQAAQVEGPLVETDWLSKHIKSVTILDVRSDLKSYTAKPEMSKNKKTGKLKLVKVGGHIPGASLVDYKRVRVDREVNGVKIESIIPLKADFEKLMQSAGVNKDSAIVIVSKGESDHDMTMATRLYWQIKYFGHDNVAILNGGMAQWVGELRPITNKSDKSLHGNWLASAERQELLASSEDVAAAAKAGVQLIDNRPLGQYLGASKKSYVYEKGHIAGAKAYPTELMFETAVPARFYSVAELRGLAKSMGVDTSKATISYCNSGHLASGGWFVMHELMGNKNVKLYDGSMHQWTREKHPVSSMKME